MNELTAVSLFAGIGGIDLALERAGIRVVAAVEVDKECRGVLRRRFPQAQLFDDVREVTGDQLIAAGFVPGRGILAGGWPCTGNSVAGRREGLGDPRSGLWRHFVRLLAETSPAWFLGENVPGLYSVNGGADIAVVRSDLARLGYWWAERILDAQHFGVPQRRTRVFFVGHSGDRAAPVEVLLEPEGGDRDSAARSQARAHAPGAAEGRAANPGIAATLQAGANGRGHRIDAESAAGGHLIPLDLAQLTHPENRSSDPMGSLAATSRPAIAYAIRSDPGNGNAHNVSYAITSRNDRNDREDNYVIAGPPELSPPLTSEGHDASEDGTGRHALIPLAATLTAGAHAESVSELGRRSEDDVNLVAEPKAFNPWTGGDMRLGYGDKPTALSCTAATGVQSATAVRRLTPLERERLQGFPDNWTRWRLEPDGREVVQSDAARDRQTGNAVAVPCVEWIARRLVAADARAKAPQLAVKVAPPLLAAAFDNRPAKPAAVQDGLFEPGAA